MAAYTLEFPVHPNGSLPPPSASSAISVRDLRKVYVVPEREGGLKSAVGSLFHRRTKDVAAVREISFEIAPGEVVGFLGPNGAGKTTTLKMLAGLLHPTSGTADVLGYTPWTRDRDYLRRMALIMGQRNQLAWDIPVVDSFELNRAIFRIPPDTFRQRRDELVELLDLQDLIRKPVRNLSLGERMKCEIAGSLLHHPAILFLDEPTIGLDVAMQRRIRQFVAEYNTRTNATVLLTSHYMADVEALCERVIVIHHGSLLYDGGLPGLVRTFSPHKTIVVEFEEGVPVEVDDVEIARLTDGEGEIVEQSPFGLTLRVPKAATARVTGQLLASLPVADLTVEDPPIEEVIERVFNQERQPETVDAPVEATTGAAT